jgi:hypothetical protein
MTSGLKTIIYPLRVRDVGGGRLIASVTDAVGNVIGLLQPSRGRATAGGH